MARKADRKQLEKLDRAIKEHPGQRPGFFARLLGWHRQKVSRSLVSLNDEEVFLYEDDQGGLWHCDDY